MQILNSGQTPTSELKLKLIQISASLEKRLGGPTAVVSQTLTYLKQHFEHKLLVFGDSEIADEGTTIIPSINHNRYGFPKALFGKLARKEIASADILLIHGYYLFSTLFSVAVSKTNKIFLMPHGSLESYQERKGRLRKYLFRLAMKVALGNRDIRFIVASDKEKESISILFPRVQIDIVGLGISETIANGRNVLDGKHEPVRLLCFSRISKKKRIDLCIRALAELNKDGIRFLLTIVGTGDPILVDGLKSLTESMNLKDQVVFRGHVADEVEIRQIFEDSDIFLLPSENENFAIAVSESIGFSVPVIVSKFVAMHDFVDEYSTGLTLENLRVADIVGSVLTVEDNYNWFRDNCEKFRHLLSWEDISKNWIKVLLDSGVATDAE